MSNQLQITGGAKVRDLNDVIIGTSGVLSSLAFNVANGVPKLDSNAKILVSQLPNSVMEYLGTWNAATNTPFLVNGTGNAGDVYLCNVAGTVDFGAGPISFVVSDQVIYSGSIWQKASGSNGTVTSIALSSTGNDAITITGSPVTTSGTINLGFAGTNLQYINGAGDLTTFPTLISSIGLSMPSAFSVANSPLTANGTIAVTGAGNASQYIRGDGTLAAYNPSTGGGGSSVSYYLNGGTNQGTFVGNTYYEMSKTAVIGTGVDFTINANGYISQFITDANDPAQLVIPAGNWNFEMYFSASSSGGSPSFYVELYKYNGSTFTLIADNSANPEYITNGTAIDLYSTAVAVPETSLTITDRLAIRVYVTHASKTITLHTEDSHLCQVITTFSTGITALNGLIAQVQYFATGTSGTDFNISSTTATHTFNIPDASATNRGLITTGSQTIAGAKTFSSGVTSSSFYAQGNGTQGGYLYLKQGITPYSTLTGANSITADATKYIFFSDAGSSNGKIALFELGSLTNNTNRTYTLPDASGTLALLEATQTFSGVNTFTSLNMFDASINYKTGGSIVNTSGYIAQGYAKSGTGAGSTLSLKISDGNSVKAINLDFVGSPATYTYTFPASSGTIALTSNLSSYVPYTGATGDVNLGTYSITGAIGTFTNGVLNGNGTNPANLYLKKGSSPFFTNAANYGLIAAVSSSFILISDVDGTNYKYASFNLGSLTNNTNRAYTLPDASGTIALTSQLTSGTVTSVGLSSATSGVTIGSSPVTTSGTITIAIATATTSQNGLLSSTDWTTFNNKQNALTNPVTGSSTSGYVAYFNGISTIAGSSNHYWDNTNSRLGINTNAPLSPLQVVIGAGSGTVARFGEASGTTGKQLLIGVDTTTGRGEIQAVWQGTSATPLALNPSSGSVLIGTTTDNGNRLQVNGTGYFAGNVGIGTTAPAMKLQIGDGTGTGNQYLRMFSSATDMYIGQSGSLFGLGVIQAIVTDSTYNNAFGIGTLSGSAPLVFATNNVERMRILSGGNVGIGITNPSYGKLVLLNATQTSMAVTAEFLATGYFTVDSAGTHIISDSAGLSLATGSPSSRTDRLTISSGGNVSIGNLAGNPFSVDSATSGTLTLSHNTSNTSGTTIATWQLGGSNTNNTSSYYLFCDTDFVGVKMVIYGNGNLANVNNSYGAYSDIKLKENITDATPKLDNLLKVKIRNFNLKGSDIKQIGVVAQELEEIFPSMIEESNDTIKDENGKYIETGEKTKSVKYSVFVPMLIKAMQEQNEIITSLQEQINELKNK
jgi:hypothetical protein